MNIGVNRYIRGWADRWVSYEWVNGEMEGWTVPMYVRYEVTKH